jgi:hypothetical protein
MVAAAGRGPLSSASAPPAAGATCVSVTPAEVARGARAAGARAAITYGSDK